MIRVLGYMDCGGQFSVSPGAEKSLLNLSPGAGRPGTYLVRERSTAHPTFGVLRWASREQLELAVRIERLKVRRAELITDALSELLTPDVALMGDRHGLRRDPDVSPNGVYRS